MSIVAVSLWLAAAADAAAVDARAAEPTPAHLVPVDDVRLAVMLLAAHGTRQPVILFDPRDSEQVSAYLAAWEGPVRCYHQPAAPAALTELLKATAGTPCTVVSEPLAFARSLWPQARTAVVATLASYPDLLSAAAFAGATGSALFAVDSGPAGEANLKGWDLERLYVTPSAESWNGIAASSSLQIVNGGSDDLTHELLRRGQAPKSVVIANPKDRSGIFSPAGISMLAPLLSVTHNAPLLLVNSSDPATIEAETYAWIDRHGIAPTHVILAGDELALRSHRVPDPVREAGGPEARGGGIEVRVELFSQIQNEQPQDLAVGRILAEGACQASMNLARQLHGRKRSSGSQPVVFLSNADEIFALGETISRTTASEVRNVGLPVEAHYRGQITPAVIRRALKQTDLLVWEGHPRDLTLEESGGIATDRAPRLVVLQGCYTLDRSDPFILLEKGTQAIVATSAAIYSASGSAFARALFDGILYDGLDLGTAVRNARNFLLALTQLKRARNHPDWRKTYRAALAFALWGDPTAYAPVQPGRPARTPVTWTRADGRLSLSIPEGRLREASVGPYRARIAPRMMLGGLLLRTHAAHTRTLKDLYWTTVAIPPDQNNACAPNPGWKVISLWAPRTRTLTVLARPDWLFLERPPHGTFEFRLSNSAAACSAD